MSGLDFLRYFDLRAYRPGTMMPYPYFGEPYEVRVERDSDGYPFAEYSGERVYFPQEMDLADVERSFRIYLEDEGLTGLGRHPKSPHSYVSAAHCPAKGDVIVDIGCSEGFFSRHYAETAGALYLFEAEEKWKAPLARTFREYHDKTKVVFKFVGAETEGRSIRLTDAFLGLSGKRFFIKMDIEGNELDVLRASVDFLQQNQVRLSCCTYHRKNDYRDIAKLLRGLGYSVGHSDGWMLPYERQFPYFRRGMIYASNIPGTEKCYNYR